MSILFLGTYRYKNMEYTESMRVRYPDHKLVIDSGATLEKPYFIHPKNVKKFKGKYGLKFLSYKEYKELVDEKARKRCSTGSTDTSETPQLLSNEK